MLNLVYSSDFQTSSAINDAKETNNDTDQEEDVDENEKLIISVETEKTVNSADRDGIAYKSEIDESRILIDRLLSLGLSNHSNDKIEEAIKNYKEAVQIANKTDHNDLRAKAYQLLGKVYTANSQYMKAIEFYQKANEIYPDHKRDDWELAAYMWLGYSHLEACQYKECIEYYNVAVKIASQLRDGRNKLNANLGLGNAFKFIEEYTSSQKYYLEALMAAEQMDDKVLQKDLHISLGDVYYQSCKFDAALKSYLKAHEISHYLGESKEVANSCIKLCYTFQHLGKDEEAIEFFQKAIKDGKDLEDKDLREEAVQRLGTLFLNSASEFIKRCDNERAIEWYKKALNLLTGLGVAWFNPCDIEKAIESIQKAETFVQEEHNDTGK